MKEITDEDILKICTLGALDPDMSLARVTKAFIKRGVLDRKVCEIISEEARRRDCGSLDRLLSKIVKEIVRKSGSEGISFNDIVHLVPSRKTKVMVGLLVYHALNTMIDSGSLVCKNKSRPFIYKIA